MHLKCSILVRGVLFRKNDFERTQHNTNVRKHTQKKHSNMTLEWLRINSVAAKSKGINGTVSITLEVDFQGS